MKAIFLAIIFILTPVLSYAQSFQCDTILSVRTQLLEKYGEVRKGSGIGQNTFFELYSNESTGSWSIVVTTTDGVSCLIAYGQEWETISSDKTPPNL